MNLRRKILCKETLEGDGQPGYTELISEKLKEKEGK